ncbi:MAG: NAD(P)-binding domain-containing protein [Candidatus Saccharimonadales bacterium]
MGTIEKFGIVGSGSFGRVAAEQLAPAGADVLIYDANPNAVFPSPDIATPASFDDVLHTDAVMLAVPYGPHFQSFVGSVNEKVQDDTLVIWPGSVQILPIKDFQTFLKGRDRANFLSCHPLFGPDWIKENKGAITGGIVAITEEHGDRQRITELTTTWGNKGLGINRDYTADEHDRVMADIQAIPFFIGQVLIDMGLLQHEDLSTGYYRQLFRLKTMEEQHSNELFRSIQLYNPYAKAARNSLISHAILRNARIITSGVVGYDPGQYPELYISELSELDTAMLYLTYLRSLIIESVTKFNANSGQQLVTPERQEELTEELRKRAAGLLLEQEEVDRVSNFLYPEANKTQVNVPSTQSEKLPA